LRKTYKELSKGCCADFWELPEERTLDLHNDDISLLDVTTFKTKGAPRVNMDWNGSTTILPLADYDPIAGSVALVSTLTLNTLTIKCVLTLQESMTYIPRHDMGK
jgi:hypothetical protein